jgi:hypothetical protein
VLSTRHVGSDRDHDDDDHHHQHKDRSEGDIHGGILPADRADPRDLVDDGVG